MLLWGLLGGLWIGMLICMIYAYRHDDKEEAPVVGAVVLTVLFIIVVFIAFKGQKSGVGAARYTYYINGIRVGSGFAAFSGRLLGSAGAGLVAFWTAKGLGYLISRIGKKDGKGVNGKTLIVLGVFTIIFGLILAIVGLVMSGARGPGAMSYREAGRALTIVGSVPLVPGALCVVFGKKKL